MAFKVLNYRVPSEDGTVNILFSLIVTDVSYPSKNSYSELGGRKDPATLINWLKGYFGFDVLAALLPSGSGYLNGGLSYFSTAKALVPLIDYQAEHGMYDKSFILGSNKYMFTNDGNNRGLCRYMSMARRYRFISNATTGKESSGNGYTTTTLIARCTDINDLSTCVGGGCLTTATLGAGNNSNTVFYSNNMIDETFIEDLLSIEPITPDPYGGGGTSGTGGGGGSFSRPTTPILKPGLPGIGEFVSETNFVTIYNPDISQLNALASYMWSDDFLTNIRKILNNPIDCIIALNIFPVAVPNGALVNVNLGNLTTNIQMPLVENQFVNVDCGSIEIKEYWGSYLDYSPFTKVEIYLPYIGVRQLKTDEIMDKTIKLSYSIDILSGACCAFIEADGNVLYQFTGSCNYPIPITQGMYSNMLSGTIGALGGVATMIGGAVSGSLPAFAAGATAALASAVSTEKEQVSKSGNLSGCVGFMGVQTPYLIFTQPRQCVAKNQNEYTGYPSYITYTLSELEGFTTVEYIHLQGLSCTDDEKNEIYRLLKEGVIL